MRILFFGVGDISSIKGCDHWVEDSGSGDPLLRSTVGMETVRGGNLPLEEMFGIPSWRDKTNGVCASIRWSESSVAIRS